MTFTVAALYRFAPFDDPAARRQPLIDLCAAQGVKGTVLLAREGINGTIAGSDDGVAAVIAHIRALPGCAELDVKYSAAAAKSPCSIETPPRFASMIPTGLERGFPPALSACL